MQVIIQPKGRNVKLHRSIHFIAFIVVLTVTMAVAFATKAGAETPPPQREFPIFYEYHDFQWDPKNEWTQVHEALPTEEYQLCPDGMAPCYYGNTGETIIAFRVYYGRYPTAGEMKIMRYVRAVAGPDMFHQSFYKGDEFYQARALRTNKEYAAQLVANIYDAAPEQVLTWATNEVDLYTYLLDKRIVTRASLAKNLVEARLWTGADLWRLGRYARSVAIGRDPGNTIWIGVLLTDGSFCDIEGKNCVPPPPPPPCDAGGKCHK